MASKKRGFVPTEIIFSCTTACNLHCAHCFINRSPSELKASEAIRFLESIASSNNTAIEKVGFSGGEPFLCVDFLCSVIKKAVDFDFMFDRIMTNGDWWKNEEDLQSVFQKIYDAGFDGKIGLSYDNFHGQDKERIARFITASWEYFGNDSVEIQSVNDTSDRILREKKQEEHFSAQTEIFRLLAKKLHLKYEVQILKNGTAFASLSDDEHFLPVFMQKESYQSSDKRAFKDEKWFADDFCEGPGQILFVHANGNIAPCCGFANENDALFIGTIRDSFDEVLKKASENEMVKLCYEEGLAKKIEDFEKRGDLPNGKTSDICTFCDWICKNPSSRLS